MKSTIKNTSFYLLLGFLPLASNFLLAPLFTRFLSPQEYGLIALASLLQNYLNIFIDLGLKGSFSRYYFRYFKNDRIVKTLFSTVIISVVSIAAIVYLFFLFFGDALFTLIFKNDLFTFHRFGHFVCVLTLSALLNAVILTVYRNEENLKKYALISLSSFFLMTIGAVIGVVVYKFGALGSVVGKMTGVMIVISIFLFFFFLRNGIRFEYRLLRPLLAYGMPLVPYGFLNITINNLDRFFIERNFDLNVLGQYNVAFLISTIPFIMLNSFQSSVNPAILKSLESAKGITAKNNYNEINRNFKIMLTFMGVILIGMISLSGLFIMFYVGSEYRSIIEYLPILILAFVPLIYQNMYSLLLFHHYQAKLLPLISLVTLVEAVLLNLVLIPFLGIYGVAVAVLGKNILFAFNTFWVLNRKGFYTKEIFSLGRFNLLPILITVSCVGCLILTRLFPTYYHLTTLAIGLLISFFVFALFREYLKPLYSIALQKIPFFKNSQH